MQSLKAILGALIAATALVQFQNCSRPTSSKTRATANAGSTTNASNSSSSANGSGVGYDGKLTYVSLASNTCADGSKIQTEIVANNGAYTLTRQNCQSIQPTSLNSNQVNLSQNNSSVLFYSGQVLTDNGQDIEVYCMDSTGLINFWVFTPPGSSQKQGQFISLQLMTNPFSVSATDQSGSTIYSGQDTSSDQFQMTVSSQLNMLYYSYDGQLAAQFGNGSPALSQSMICYRK